MEVLEQVPPEDRACGLLSFDDESGGGTKVLGLHWSQRDDTFRYAVQPKNLITTKRGMLSLIARIIDPLGLLAPVIFMAKHLMQRMWQFGISWDEQLPPNIVDVWNRFVADLPILQTVHISRFIGTQLGVQGHLCGFFDASEKGFSAVVYLRLRSSFGPAVASLLGAKTKLVPTKASTIPRLKLCAAVLLARWMARLKLTLERKIKITQSYAWSDSTTVLSWLKLPHDSFKFFVSNRVHKVTSLLPACQWNYISSTSNPAGCASRGIFPTELVNHKLYWNGPDVLYRDETEWMTLGPKLLTDGLPEMKTAPLATFIANTKEPPEPEWYARFSSYIHMIRVITRMYRFINGCRRLSHKTDFLSRDELDHAAVAS